MFHENERLECSVVTRLKLTARERLGWKALSADVKRYDGAQQTFIAEPQSRLHYHEEVQERRLKREKSGTSKYKDKEGSLKMKVPRSRWKREEQGVQDSCSAVHKKTFSTFSSEGMPPSHTCAWWGFKLYRAQKRLDFYRTLLGWAQALLKKGKSSTENFREFSKC